VSPARRRAAALAAILLAAALIRLPALRTQLWLDEVWSLDFARGAKTLSALLFQLHHDNNNPLNTWWLWSVSGATDFAIFRLASFVAGLLSVAVLAYDPEDPTRGLLTAALAAVSLPMVLFSTEARGYALMALFSVMSWRLLSVRPPFSRQRIAAFAACTTLGLFSHPLFICVLAGLAASALAKLTQEERRRPPWTLLALFVPAPAVFALYTLLQTGPTVFGAGAFNPFFPTLAHALAQWAGADASSAWSGPAILAVLGLCGAELLRLRRSHDDEFWFFTALAAATCAVVAVFPFRYERHFFVCLPFVLVLSSRTLTRMVRSGGASRMVAVVMLAFFVSGSAAGERSLATAGRGHYLDALDRMARDTAGSVVSVGSDHDFRNKVMVDFYAPYASGGKSFSYVDENGWKAGGPEWYLRHSFETDPRTAPVALHFRGGEDYRLVDVYPYSGLSGWMWALYRRVR
jgi:hypothetical protein